MTLLVDTLCILLNTDLSSISRCSPSTLPAWREGGEGEGREGKEGRGGREGRKGGEGREGREGRKGGEEGREGRGERQGKEERITPEEQKGSLKLSLLSSQK